MGDAPQAVQAARVTAPGKLLSMEDPDRGIARGQDRRSGRSPAVERDSARAVEYEAMVREFLARGNLGAEYEKLSEFFPDGKGVNRSIRLSLILSNRGVDGDDAFSEITLATRVQSEIYRHAESSVVSLDHGLAKMPREATAERFAVIRLLSNIGSMNPSLREEVKSSLVAEAKRSGNQADGALVFAALLRMDSSQAWLREVNRSFEKLHPGSELSDFVAVNVVAL